VSDGSRNSGDPARTIALLWGRRELSRLGPRHALSVARIVETAIAIADCDRDLAPMSMRRVAEALDVGTMSLYTYIASRAELVEAMLDAAYAEAVSQLADADIGDWRTGLARVAAVNWEMHLRHPWMLQVSTGRPPLGPNAIAKYELELQVVDEIGLTDAEMDAVVTLLHTHLQGLARLKIEAENTERRTGLTDAQWWEATAPILAEVFDPSQFPIAARVGQAAGQQHQSAYNPEHAYQFGLERLIAGVDALIQSRERAQATLTTQDHCALGDE
jgi:AcrR family transcriptional regulator